VIRILVAVFAALVLVGCSSDTPTAPSSAASGPISDAQYLALVRDQDWVTPNMTDANLLMLGNSACAVITEQPADGKLTGWKRAVDGATSNGTMSAEEAGGFLVYASARFCPEARAAHFPPAG
jgi:Protein of unknown function (DUF732)